MGAYDPSDISFSWVVWQKSESRITHYTIFLHTWSILASCPTSLYFPSSFVCTRSCVRTEGTCGPMLFSAFIPFSIIANLGTSALDWDIWIGELIADILLILQWFSAIHTQYESVIKCYFLLEMLTPLSA